MERFVKSEVLAKKDTFDKTLRLDLTDVNNLHAVENVKVGSVAALVCKKAKKVQKCKTNAPNFLVHLVKKLKENCNWISSLCANHAETSYKSFIKSNDVKERMKAFTRNLRIDTLYMELLKAHIELREVVKIILILSHGNARVEAGVSVNEDMLSENMFEEALVAHRII